MRKIIVLSLVFMFLCMFGSASAAPGYSEQIDLIASNADLWKQDYEFGQWGYIVTDLDQNGRMEIISCSVQGTGFYSYIKAYEVNEEGTGLDDLMKAYADRTDSSPDIMTSRIPVFYDRNTDRYYYIFDDMIRNGMAEYYENKRAVCIADGEWQETPLAFRSTVYTDADHSTVTCTDSAGNTISETQFDEIAGIVFSGLELSETCLNWQMTDVRGFAALTKGQLTDDLKTAAETMCLLSDGN